MAETTEQTEQLHPAGKREHYVSIQTSLILTFVGGVFVLNAYIADLIFPDIEALGGFSALIGALILGVPLIIDGFEEMRQGRMHMRVLVSIAVLAAFALTDYRIAGIVAFFMRLASLIEQQTAKGARESVERLMTLTPDNAELVSGEEIPVSKLRPGHKVRIHPGDSIPADGKVTKGQSTVDEATITGEPLPADKTIDDDVFAGTHNLTGYMEIEVSRAGEDTTLGKVKDLILKAEATKTPIMQLIDQYAEWYTPVVLMIGVIIYVFTRDAGRVITAWVVACPTAFVLATPTAMVAGLSAAARLGILIKNVAHLEAAGNITAMIFDKTGTLTTGQLTVTKLSPTEDVEGAQLLEAAASVEQNSRHPVARAVTDVAERARVVVLEPKEVEEAAGKGVRGTVEQSEVVVGRKEWLEENGIEVPELSEKDDRARKEGLSTLYVAKDGRYLGWIGLEDKARPDAKEATADLKNLGVKRLAMLTGDRWSVARKVAGELGCNEVQAECLPERKLKVVERLREEDHHVAVVGDGVNDGPALAAGDLGIAMGAAGSDVAINSASIALMSSELDRLPFLVRLSRRLKTVIFQNLTFGAFFVVGGLLLSTFGYLNPIIAALLHIIASFIVIFNSARLVRFGETLSPHTGRAAEKDKSAAAATA